MRQEALIDTVTLGADDDDPHLEGVDVIPPEKDRIVRPKEAAVITGRSLSSQYRDKVAGKWVPAYRIGQNSVGFKLSDLLALNASREIVNKNNTVPVAVPKIGKRRGRKPKNTV